MLPKFFEFQLSPTTLEDAASSFTLPTDEAERDYNINRKNVNEFSLPFRPGVYRVIDGQLFRLLDIYP